ncbi:unnamed protein product [Larinioides sclopetarius]|uniref:C2H2-type domain-containing protein n=1 Tax=Larinioides sclopetarius TaxID=280406 RepID=A0AAV2BXX0_9ARAC
MLIISIILNFLASCQVLTAASGCRLYKCTKCSRIFGQKAHLIRHLERHEDYLFMCGLIHLVVVFINALNVIINLVRK